MTPSVPDDRASGRLTQALRLVLRRYAAQLRKRPALAIPAMLLPAAGDILTVYAPPLVIARLLGALAREERLGAAELVPYVATFAGLWLSGQIVWRIAIALMIRAEIRSMEALYIEAMDELLAKDLSFFQNNYAGSLTKRALGYARRFEDVFDIMAFQGAATILPLVFVGVVLWQYSPWLIVALLTMMLTTLMIVLPLIRRRRTLVNVREVASNVLAGHVADSITNAEAVRAFAREPEEARG